MSRAICADSDLTNPHLSDGTDELLGHIPEKAAVLMGEEHRIDTGPFSCDVSLFTVSLCLTAAEGGLIWGSLLCFSGMERSQMLF